MTYNTFYLVFSEIMYNPRSTPDNSWEWIEIYHAGDTSIDLSGYVIDDNNGLNHAAANIASGTIVAGETAILFNNDELDAADFEAAWGTGINLIGVTGWNKIGLNNTGDTVSLWSSFSSYSGDHQTHANAIDTVDYNAAGFPDLVGSSIYLIDLNADNSIGSNWLASSDGGTTPIGNGYMSTNAGGNSGNDIGSPLHNFPPRISGIPNTTIDEDSSYSFTPTANDTNGDNLTFSIANSPSWTTFDTNSGILSGTPTNDDVGITSNIIISVSDGTYTVSLAAFDLTVNNTNDTPSFSSTEITSITEDTVYSYDITTIDPDIGDILTITANTFPSWLNFTDNGNGTATLTGTPTNNEVGTHNIELQVEDATNATATQNFTITVNNINDSPNLSDTSFNLDENATNNTSVGIVTGTDPDFGDRLTYTIIAGNDDSIFAINSDTGEITVDDNSKLNFETTSNYDLIIEVSDSSLNDSATVTVNLINVNETPSFSSTEITSITEDTVYSYDITTIDPDIGDILTITANTFPSWLNFTDNGNGTATLTGTPTNNEVGTHNIELQVEDAANATATQNFTITVNNINDSPSLSDTSFNLDENATNNTSVGIVTGTDPDFGDRLTYTIIAGNDDSIFAINSDTGEITVQDNTNLDYEINAGYLLTVEVQDDGIENLTDIANIIVNVVDINDTPTDLILSNHSIDENELIETIVGYFRTTDQDINDSHNYSFISGIGDTDNDKFKIIGNQLLTQDYFDFETQSSYSIRVKTTDLNGLTFDKKLTISINDIDDAPLVKNAIANVEVNEDADDTIIDLSNIFTDIDNDDSAILKVVSLNSNENLVTATVEENLLTLDYQDNQSGIAEITIQGISNNQTVEQTFTITVNAVDDAPLVKNAIANVEVNEDADDTIIDLSNIFTDIDNDDSAILKVVSLNSNENLVTATVEENLLTLDYQENQSGIAEITIEGISNNQTVEQTLTVTVDAVDDSPIVENAITDIEVDEDTEDTIIDLSNIFTDIDNNNEQIIKTLKLNSNSTLVEATVDGNILTLNYQENQNGIAEITIEGISNSQKVTETFTVTVNLIEDVVDDKVEPEIKPEIKPELEVPLPPQPEAIEPEIEPEIEIIEPEPEAKIEPEIQPEIDIELKLTEGEQSIIEPSKPEQLPQPQPETVSIFDPTELISIFSTLNLEENIVSQGVGKFSQIGTANADFLVANSTNNHILALDENDTVNGGDGNDWINGNTENDMIDGGNGNDRLYGGKGDDTVVGSAGNDRLNGDIGEDILDSGEGNDIVFGDQDNDTILGGANHDEVYGNLGDDLLEGNGGNDSLYGGQNHDTISGNDGNDIINGDDGDDLLDGNTGDDVLDGGDGNDTLDGGSGDDELIGNTGNDILVGAAGNDTLTGGTGSDRFVLILGYDTDTITDFEPGSDRFFLDGNLTFQQLTIESVEGMTLIRFNQEVIAIITNIEANLINSNNFTNIL